MRAKPTSWPAPIAFDDALCVRHLVALTGNRDSGIFALRLWHHRRRCGEYVPGPNAEATVEVIAGGGQRRRGLAAHLLSAGLVQPDRDGLRIRPWDDTAAVDWTRSGQSDEQSIAESAGQSARSRPTKPRQPSADALRKWEKRHPGEPHPSGLTLAGLGTDSVRTDDSPTPDSYRTRTGPEHSPADSPDQSADGPDSVRPVGQLDPGARTCATGTSTGTSTSFKNTPKPPKGAQCSSLEQRPLPTAGGDGSALSPVEAGVTEVLEHWKAQVWIPSGGSTSVKIEGNGSEGRRKFIRPLLREGWSVERLKRVVDGVALDDHMMGRSATARPGGWTEAENVFRRSKLDAREKAATAARARPAERSGWQPDSAEVLKRDPGPPPSDEERRKAEAARRELAKLTANIGATKPRLEPMTAAELQARKELLSRQASQATQAVNV